MVAERVKQKRSDLPRLLLEPAACARQKGNSDFDLFWPHHLVLPYPYPCHPPKVAKQPKPNSQSEKQKVTPPFLGVCTHPIILMLSASPLFLLPIGC